MKVILIEEDRFPEILDMLRAESKNFSARSNPFADRGVSQQSWDMAVADMHRSTHFHLVRWMQSQGARACR